ncbi:hypothetical protein BDR04DRAFT_1117040 [Suillus decipiens]|nr:hypothetical protein BDR04DRAFT_1117040 [Suillus decipiens]
MSSTKLNKNFCQEPFAGHTLANCPKGFSDGALYKTLTAVTVAAKRGWKKGGGVVATVEVENMDKEKENNTVAMVMPSVILGNGTNSGKECMAPLQTSHLHWMCLLDRPAVTSPVSVSALIDHGSSLVLIGEDLVIQLSLCQRKLSKLLPITLAMSQNIEPVSLSHYVKLSYKDTNYDLLGTQQPPAMPKHTAPWGPQLFWMKHVVIKELKSVLPELKTIINNACKPIKDVNLVAVIQDRIDMLIYQDELKFNSAPMTVQRSIERPGRSS